MTKAQRVSVLEDVTLCLVMRSSVFELDVDAAIFDVV